MVPYLEFNWYHFTLALFDYFEKFQRGFLLSNWLIKVSFTWKQIVEWNQISHIYFELESLENYQLPVAWNMDLDAIYHKVGLVVKK